jgi:hypothetical protein
VLGILAADDVYVFSFSLDGFATIAKLLDRAADLNRLVSAAP